MPAIQTTYAAQHARWVEGMVLNSEPGVIISREVQTAAGIGFGKVAIRGTGDHQIAISAAGGKYLGLTVMDTTQAGAVVDVYPQYATAAVMTKGVIVAQASVAVAAGDAVYFVPTTGVLTNVASGNTIIPNAQWDTATTGAGLAAIRLA